LGPDDDGDIAFAASGADILVIAAVVLTTCVAGASADAVDADAAVVAAIKAVWLQIY